MKLYYNPLSTYSQKVLMACYEKNVAFEPVVVDLMTPEGVAEYEAVYPVGKVPLLKPTPDYMIPESSIIIEYLEGHYSQGTRLIPDGVDAGRQVRFADRVADLYLNDPCTQIFFHRFGFAQHSDATLAKAHKLLKLSYAMMDRRLNGSEWLCGDFSMADCAAIPALYYAQIVAPFTDYSNLVRYFELARKRPSYARVAEEFVPIWEGMRAQLAGTKQVA